MAGFGTKQNEGYVSRRALTTKQAATQVLADVCSLFKIACMHECDQTYFAAVDICLPYGTDRQQHSSFTIRRRHRATLLTPPVKAE